MVGFPVRSKWNRRRRRRLNTRNKRRVLDSPEERLLLGAVLSIGFPLNWFAFPYFCGCLFVFVVGLSFSRSLSATGCEDRRIFFKFGGSRTKKKRSAVCVIGEGTNTPAHTNHTRQYCKWILNPNNNCNVARRAKRERTRGRKYSVNDCN